jgi:hypothetical protein
MARLIDLDQLGPNATRAHRVLNVLFGYVRRAWFACDAVERSNGLPAADLAELEAVTDDLAALTDRLRALADRLTVAYLADPPAAAAGSPARGPNGSDPGR